MFAPRPGATDEDDGAILSVVFDAATNSSFVAVLDAATMVERARVEAPGGFFRSTQPGALKKEPPLMPAMPPPAPDMAMEPPTAPEPGASGEGELS